MLFAVFWCVPSRVFVTGTTVDFFNSSKLVAPCQDCSPAWSCRLLRQPPPLPHSRGSRPASLTTTSAAPCPCPQARTVLSRLLWPPWEGEPVFCTLRSRKQCEVHWWVIVACTVGRRCLPAGRHVLCSPAPLAFRWPSRARLVQGCPLSADACCACRCLLCLLTPAVPVVQGWPAAAGAPRAERVSHRQASMQGRQQVAAAAAAAVRR